MEVRAIKKPVINDDGILLPSLKVSAGSGAAGLLFGAIVGTVRSAHPVLWATVTGIQWSLLGGTYWSFRLGLLKTRTENPIPSETKSYISAASGGLSAALVGGITRGRSNIIPGTFVGSLVGFLGQRGYTFLDGRNTEAMKPRMEEEREPFWRRAMQSRWSPVKHLSHEEYKKVLEDKLLRVDAEIAVIDDDIAALRKQEIVESDAKE